MWILRVVTVWAKTVKIWSCLLFQSSLLYHVSVNYMLRQYQTIRAVLSKHLAVSHFQFLIQELLSLLFTFFPVLPPLFSLAYFSFKISRDITAKIILPDISSWDKNNSPVFSNNTLWKSPLWYIWQYIGLTCNIN